MVLIGGETLANLMIDHSVGVTFEEAYEIKGVENGKIKESWTVSDAMTVMQQLGAL